VNTRSFIAQVLTEDHPDHKHHHHHLRNENAVMISALVGVFLAVLTVHKAQAPFLRHLRVGSELTRYAGLTNAIVVPNPAQNPDPNIRIRGTEHHIIPMETIMPEGVKIVLACFNIAFPRVACAWKSRGLRE